MDRRFKFACGCGQHLVARQSMVGTTVHCPACRCELTIPSDGEAVDTAQYQKVERYTVACSCGRRMLVKAPAAGQVVHCPQCQKAMRVPSLELLHGRRAASLETRDVAREQINTEDLLLLVDDDEGPGSEVR